MDFEIKYITEASQLENIITALLSTCFYGNRLIGLDTETSGLDCHIHEIRIVQLAINTKLVYIFDRWKIGKEFTDKQLKRLFSNVAKFPKKKKITFTGQNLKFDIKMLWSIGVDLSLINIFDTMIGAKILEAGLNVKFGLGDLTERYLNVYTDKSQQKSDWSIFELSQEQLKYAAIDVIRCIELVYKLVILIKEALLKEVFKLEMRTIFPTAAMEFFGGKLDVDKLEKLVRPEQEEILKKSQTEFLKYIPNHYNRYNLLGDLLDVGINIASSDQVLKILQQLKIPDPNGEFDLIQSTGKTVVGLLDLEKYPIIYALLDYKGANTVLTNYIYSLPAQVNPVTGRLHTEYDQCKSTGRFSSSQPNLQKLPRPKYGQKYTVRSCFVAEEGNVFALCDFSQIELRVIAEIIYQRTGDSSMLDEFLADKDPYASTAAALSNMTYEEFLKLSKDEYKLRRQRAKPVRLGFNYGMFPTKFKNYALLQYGVKLTQAEAEAVRKLYFSLYPGLVEYHKSFQNKYILEARTLPPFNRRRLWEQYCGVPGLSNLAVQGASGDIQKLAMCLVYEELYSKGFSPTQSRCIMPVYTIHDELVLESRIDLAEEAKELVERNMINAAETVLTYCPVKADAVIVNNLAEKP